jgi:hypothetical protein
MKTSNLVTESVRQSESGQTWEEKLTNATGSLELPKRATFRVRATGATTVTIDGILAATMSASEILVFNTGDGDPDDAKNTVSVVIAAAAAFVQVARELKRQSLV